MQNHRNWASLALVPVFVLAAAPAFAETTDPDVHHMAVRYDDLDLSTAKGRHLLDSRLRHSAAEVCGHEDGQQPRPEDMEGMHCYDKALTNARMAMAGVINHAQMAMGR
jgi:UrcA family protein